MYGRGWDGTDDEASHFRGAVGGEHHSVPFCHVFELWTLCVTEMPIKKEEKV